MVLISGLAPYIGSAQIWVVWPHTEAALLSKSGVVTRLQSFGQHLTDCTCSAVRCATAFISGPLYLWRKSADLGSQNLDLKYEITTL